jgi:hypothetical protein
MSLIEADRSYVNVRVHTASVIIHKLIMVLHRAADSSCHDTMLDSCQTHLLFLVFAYLLTSQCISVNHHIVSVLTASV